MKKQEAIKITKSIYKEWNKALKNKIHSENVNTQCNQKQNGIKTSMKG